MGILLNSDRIVDKEINRFIGCELPFTKGQFGYFSPSIYTIDQIKSNIKNLILTNKGERLMYPEFGCDIYRYMFENIVNNEEYEDLIISTIEEAISTWLPFVNIVETQVNLSNYDIDKNILNIKLSFSLKNDIIVEELSFTIYQDKN